MDEHNPKRPTFYYWIVALVIIVLLNSFLFPMLTSSNVKEVSYNTFLNELEKRTSTRYR